MTKKYHFDCDGRYTYGFTSYGLFTVIDKEGQSLYSEAIPLCEKLGGHLLWIFLWIVVLVASNLFCPDSVILIIDRIFMSLIFFHLFLFGCRLTSLLLIGGFRPIFFPPLWMRLTRELQKGQGIEILKKHNLSDHPGLLVNLALVQLSREQIDEGRHTLRHALALCPGHPDLISIHHHFFQNLESVD
ncbi:MAG: hypothetical protein JJU12_03505 [Chlamydiales bacterium]|nr:hypothetical protein [Chlamydiales bacterium]